jgi:YhcG PDDEXK nuclease domain
MNFYLSAVDDQLRHPDDKLSIGLVLCKTRSKVVAEYALRNLGRRSEWRATGRSLLNLSPQNFRVRCRARRKSKMSFNLRMSQVGSLSGSG